MSSRTDVHTDPTHPRKVSHYCGSIEAAPEKAATSLQGLTKSTPAIAKQQGASMATPKPKPDLRPDDPRHGTTTGYRVGCRLACCRRAMANAAALRRKRQYLSRTEALSVPGLGTHRRIQALVALGWSLAQISREAGYVRSHSPLVLARGQLNAATARRFADVYDRLAMSPPPETNKAERISASRSRNLAASKGWVPPLMWDDIDNDPAPAKDMNDTEDNFVDEVKVRRVINGWLEDCNTAERYAVIERWDDSITKLEQLTGWHVHRMLNQKKVA